MPEIAPEEQHASSAKERTASEVRGPVVEEQKTGLDLAKAIEALTTLLEAKKPEAISIFVILSPLQ